MEYKIPQNIDIEDRIVGPLTMRQFVIFLIAAAGAFMLYLALSAVAFPLFVILSGVILLAAIALAFVDYGGRHAESIILDAIVSATKPKRMVWKKERASISTENNQQQAQQPKREDSIPAVVAKSDFNEVKEKLRRATSYSDSGTAPGPYPAVEDELVSSNPALDQTISVTTQQTKQEEPLLSQLASVEPNQKFEYPKIETRR